MNRSKPVSIERARLEAVAQLRASLISCGAIVPGSVYDASRLLEGRHDAPVLRLDAMGRAIAERDMKRGPVRFIPANEALAEMAERARNGRAA